MEQENKKKRARDIEDSSREETSAKKQNLNNYNLVIGDDHKGTNYKNKDDEENDIFQRLEYSSCTPHAVEQVFDFPWLKEGMISKSEDWKFEDTFTLSLEDSCCTTIDPDQVLEIMSEQCSTCQTSAATELLDYPEDKLEGDLVDSVDGIWSSLLSHPLPAGVINNDNDRGV